MNDMNNYHVPVMAVGPVVLMNTIFNDILYELMVVFPTDPAAAI
jgi:hypothetical protein